MGDAVSITALTWNIAAINNNPFEYWIDHTDPRYNQLMQAAASFVSEPGSRDVPVSKLFTSDMFAALKAQMVEKGWEGVEETAAAYKADFANRRIISGFLKDVSLGKKRLASWPDRHTNTMAGPDGVVCRPTVINCFNVPLPNLDVWFKLWLQFMFSTKINSQGQHPCDVLSPIRRSKYPEVTEEEERISVPLQTLCLAIFDAIQVHILNQSEVDDWLGIKRSIMEKMNLGKVGRTVEILESYGLGKHGASIMCLQECGKAFLAAVKRSKLHELYFVLESSSADPNRDQNSLVLLRRGVFGDDIKEHSDAAFEAFPAGADVPVARGDLLIVSAPLKLRGDERCIVASFHGDTNGLASIPVVKAVHAATKAIEHSTFVFGLDANVYEAEKKGLATFSEFVAFTQSLGYETTWGPKLSAQNYTTFNARTFLQPQLNKASTMESMGAMADRNPKDFILVNSGQFKEFRTSKDNTGRREYIEGVPFPSLSFPSDHGIVLSQMEFRDP